MAINLHAMIHIIYKTIYTLRGNYQKCVAIQMYFKNLPISWQVQVLQCIQLCGFRGVKMTKTGLMDTSKTLYPMHGV